MAACIYVYNNNGTSVCVCVCGGSDCRVFHHPLAVLWFSWRDTDMMRHNWSVKTLVYPSDSFLVPEGVRE